MSIEKIPNDNSEKDKVKKYGLYDTKNVTPEMRDAIDKAAHFRDDNENSTVTSISGVQKSQEGAPATPGEVLEKRRSELQKIINKATLIQSELEKVGTATEVARSQRNEEELKRLANIQIKLAEDQTRILLELDAFEKENDLTDDNLEYILDVNTAPENN